MISGSKAQNYEGRKLEGSKVDREMTRNPELEECFLFFISVTQLAPRMGD
jgi:hypothetical protein